MVSITVYDGAGRIGGNKIFLRDGDSSIIFDFGQPFEWEFDKYFYDWLQPRDRVGLKDLFFFDLMPRISGLYSEEALEHTDMEYEDPKFDAIFVSHMHWDHTDHLRYVDPSIPVYLGECANMIRESWEITSRQKFGDHDYRTFRSGKRIKAGNIDVIPVHVDHSIPSAYGFIAHTSDGAVVYTGDFRMHGPRADMTGEFEELAREEKPIALICEGTKLGERKPTLSEKEVEKRGTEIAKRSSKLVVVWHYPRDIDRINTFQSVAEKSGRDFVISMKCAHLLETLSGDKELKIPDLSDVLIYVPYKKRYEDWENKFINYPNVVHADDVRRNQSKIIMQIDFERLTELVDILPDGGEFIRSRSEPYEEDDVSEEVLDNWLDRLNMRKHQLHSSGHCTQSELITFVKKLNPKHVIPVHTEHPEELKKRFKNVIVPSRGDEIKIK